MKITDFLIISFEQHFKHPLETAARTLTHRNGFIIQIMSDEFKGYGESSPLDGFNTETLQEVSYALESYRLVIDNLGETSVDELLSLIPIYSDELASVEFGLETAIYDLASKIEGKSLAKYLNPSAQNRVLSNGIAGIHGPGENYPILKVKVGFRNLFDELNYLDELTIKFGEDIKFRLDANGSMDLPRSIRFCKEVERFNIDYVEQPLPKHELEDLSELRNHTAIPIAVDESLTNSYSAERIIEKQSADVFIIKPMASGGFGTCKKIVSLASSEKINSVITSSLEGPIGLSACTHFASALSIDKVCGLSTGTFYDNTLSKPFNIDNGVIQLSDLPGLGVTYDIT